VLIILVNVLLNAGEFNLFKNNVFAGVKVEKSDEGYSFSENGRKILFYQLKPKSLNGTYTRCHYIHPLFGLDGEILTEDFPDDHLHHRGIFWAWHQVLVGDKRVGDPWSTQNFSWDVVESSVIDTIANVKTLKVKVNWKSPLWTDSQGNEKPLVKEILYLSVYPENENFRVIDFHTSLYALEQKIYIGGSNDEKGYGGFSARFRLPGDIQFTGKKGSVVPQKTSVNAGPWLDFSGSFTETGTSGITIFCHSKNPQFPQRWILRQQKSMQNPVFPGREPVLLHMEEPLILSYRLIVHRGDVNFINLNKLFEQYSKYSSVFFE